MRLALALVLIATAADAAATSPQETAWRTEIERANKHFSTEPHAVLKIQDAAYVRNGDTYSLIGVKEKPETYRWVKGSQSRSVLIAGVRSGEPFVTFDKHVYAEKDINKGIQVDIGVDVRGEKTQVDAGVIGARFWVYNQDNPAAKSFKGLIYYPYDPSYVVTATFKPDPALPARVFRTSRGTDKQFYHAGDATFALKGKRFTLPFFSDSNDPKTMSSLSAFFTDGLTGKETYGSGRYVDVDHFGPYPPKTMTIDFNYAYNPNCARSAFFTCPVALDNLAMDIGVGEKDPHKAH
jgi:uncharacterized protein (DUF1684 family)